MHAVVFATVLIVLLLSTAVVIAQQQPPASPALKKQFVEWQAKYNRAYTSPSEFDRRFEIWASNVQLIELHNEKFRVGLSSYELGLNEYADLSWEEFKSRFLFSQPQDCSATGPKSVHNAVKRPTFVDWRTKGVVTKVKNQGSCGSCWTFSTTGAVESHTAIKTGVLPYLSESQLIDCAQNFNNHGCNGGLPSQAFEYIHWAGGIQGEDSYPYVPQDAPCKFDKSLALATVVKSMNITEGDEDGIIDAIAQNGPVSIAYQVVSDFRLYKSGVYSSTVCKNGSHDVNHAVLAVGFDTTTTQYGKPYYIVKNSWGTSFGMDGYFLIELGKNMCGLSQCAAWPLV